MTNTEGLTATCALNQFLKTVLLNKIIALEYNATVA